MKKPLLLVFHQEEELYEFEVVLRRFGLEVRICSRIDQVRAITKKDSPDLVVLYHQPTRPGRKKTSVLSVLGGATALFEQRPGLLAVHEFLRKNLEIYSRRHPRMEVDLPGVFFRSGTGHIAGIRSLGTGGAFIKTGFHDIAEGDEVEVAVPLLGMNKELEIRGRVAYRIAPGQENNYLHGFGVRFAALDEPTRESVQEYLSYTLDEVISTRRESALDFRYGLRTSPEGRGSAAGPCRISLRN